MNYRGNLSYQEVKLLEALREQKQEQSDLLDVKITGDEGQELKAHWCVLLSCPYFECMYRCGFKEKETGIVDLKSHKFPAVRQAVDFLYRGSFDVRALRESELDDLLKVADYMQIEILRKKCIKQISQDPPNIENCLRLWVLSYLYKFEDSKMKKIELFVDNNFKELLIIKRKLLLEIPKGLVVSLLTNSRLSFVTQDEFAQFLVDWIKLCFHSRKLYLNELIPHIKLKKLTYNMLKRVKRICKSVGNCQIYLLKCQNELRSRKGKGELRDFKALHPEVALISDGKYVLYYNIDVNVLGKLCKLPVKGVDCSMVSAYDTELYVVTSCIILDVQFLYLYKLDLRTRIWAPRVSFDFNYFGSCHFSVLNIHLIKGKVYIFGKMKNTSQTNKCKIMLVQWTTDRSYPMSEMLNCCEEEEVQFSVLKDCEVAIYTCIPQVYHKKKVYGYGSLYLYNIDQKRLSIIKKAFLIPIDNIRLLSYDKDIYLLNSLDVFSGIYLQFDNESETYRTEFYPKMRKSRQIKSCCVLVRGKIYEFKRDEFSFFFKRKIVSRYNLKNLKVKSFKTDLVIKRTLWSSLRDKILRNFVPQERAVSLCRLPWDITCCPIFCQHCEKEDDSLYLEDDNLSDLSDLSLDSEYSCLLQGDSEGNSFSEDDSSQNSFVHDPFEDSSVFSDDSDVHGL